MAITKKIRFEIFKRDGFACAYCGKTPPSVVLEVDHIDPKSRGGEDDINNLITACFDCNRGKRDIPLSKVPSKLNDNLDVLKEQEEQIKAYRKFVKKIDARLNAATAHVNKIFQTAYPNRTLTDSFLLQVKNFIKKLPEHEVFDAMEISAGKGFDSGRTVQYFCGVCWRKIKGTANSGAWH